MNSQLDLGGDPEQLLQQASVAARSMVEGQLRRQAELEAELEKVKTTIMRLNQLAALGTAPEELPVVRGMPRRRVFLSTRAPTTEPTAEDKARAEATALDDIEQVLSVIDEPLAVGELREKIRVMLDRAWAESTLYNHLGKGKAEGRYKHENNKWSLIPVGEQL